MGIFTKPLVGGSFTDFRKFPYSWNDAQARLFKGYAA